MEMNVNEKYTIMGNENDFGLKLTDENRRQKLKEIEEYLKTAEQFVFIALERNQTENIIVSMVSHVKVVDFIGMMRAAEFEFLKDIEEYQEKNRGK